MLCDFPLLIAENKDLEPRLQFIQDSFKSCRKEEGVFETSSYLRNIDKTLDPWSCFDPETGGFSKDWKSLSSYGVADSLDQVKDKYKALISNPNMKTCLTFHTVLKEDQPEEYGFRFHKNGTYIGDVELTQEYLHDEPLVDSVICFHFYVINEADL